MSGKMDFFELNREMFEDAAAKNKLLAQSGGEYVAFLYKEAADRDEVLEVYAQNEFLKDYDVVLFGENVPEGECGLAEMLPAVSQRLFGMVIRKKLLADIGCFNEKLSALGNYEFLCRCAAGRLYCIPCAAETECENGAPNECAGAESAALCVQAAETAAYAMRHHMSRLQACGRLENVFGAVCAAMARCGVQKEFQDRLSDYLENTVEYERIAADTAPFFVISGDETCYGVLNDFADSLADALASLGQAVVTTNGRYGTYEGLESIDGLLLKGIVGFQAPVLERDYFRRKSCRKFQFWFDNPVYFNNMFRNLPDDYFLLCQDRYYAEHIQKYYHVKNALQFPPAGKDGGYAANRERPYDVVFIGTYSKHWKNEKQADLKGGFLDYMLEHPKETFEEGFRAFLAKQGVQLDEKKFLEDLWQMPEIFHKVTDFYRVKVMEILLAAGIKVHVYGDSWKQYDGAGRENLLIHEAVSVEESLKILGQAKIGLNVMTWHKAGMTERVANIMLSGAVCLSDETVYLRENFAENEEIVLFELDRLEELPQKVERLLGDEAYRQEIAARAYKKASALHTWKKRAEELLRL